MMPKTSSSSRATSGAPESVRSVRKRRRGSKHSRAEVAGPGGTARSTSSSSSMVKASGREPARSNRRSGAASARRSCRARTSSTLSPTIEGTRRFAQTSKLSAAGSCGSSKASPRQSTPRPANGRLSSTVGPWFRYQLPPGNAITTGMHPARTAWKRRIRKVLSPGSTGQNTARRIWCAHSAGDLLPASRLATTKRCGRCRCHLCSSSLASLRKGRWPMPSAAKTRRSLDANSCGPGIGIASVTGGGMTIGPDRLPHVRGP
mmetsp:Transcript_74794/g.236367  ORF Transcript_74794/g.236367 Transcript_74794/m.236367 type:complete len:261 (+) Transcript_74794:346-1128(+)